MAHIGHTALFLMTCALLVVTSSATVKSAALSGHNNYRRQEAIREQVANMNKLKWSADLASKAKAWTSKCRWGHQGVKGQGENLFMQAPYTRNAEFYVNAALKSWMAEKAKYNGDKSFRCCGQSTQCCHYTQVVSAKSDKVGCAVTRCGTLRSADGSSVVATNAAYVACFYSPPGNLISGNNYVPYTKGRPCSKCDKGETCRNSLCV